MGTHTPGPWRVVAGTQIRGLKDQIARVWMMRSGEGSANAHLIAAAPELVGILRRITEKVKRANDIQHSGIKILPEDWAELYMLQNEAFAILAKAEGKQ